MFDFKILVPVDFTCESELAVDMALEIGNAQQADIDLLQHPPSACVHLKCSFINRIYFF